jgi:hypothetical protein
VQISPSQPGHEQACDAWSFVDSHFDFAQQDVSQQAAGAAAPASDALRHPQLPHLHTSQVQNSPLQSGHAQSTQRQPDTFGVSCAIAKLHAKPATVSKLKPIIE